MSVVLLFKTRTPTGVFTCEARVPDIYNLIRLELHWCVDGCIDDIWLVVETMS